MLTRLTAVGAAFLLSGVIIAGLIAISFPELPLSSCTDVGYTGDEPPGGFELYDFHLGWIGYSPDGGVNRCDTPVVTIVVGLSGIGSAILGIDRWR